MRTYLVFGSHDVESVKWHLLGRFDATSAGQARSLGMNSYSVAYDRYAAVPERNWAAASPEVVERAPVVRWKDDLPGQMSVEEVLKEAEEEGLLEEVPAKEPSRPADTLGL